MSNGTDKLKRVIWRLQEQNPANKDNRYSLHQLRRCIMFECGTNFRTIEVNIASLLELRWLKRINRYSFKITGEHDY